MLNLLQPKPNTLFGVVNNRLALFNQIDNHLQYWNQYWSNQEFLQNLINNGKKGDLGEFDHLIKKYVNKNELILEAGCGPGHLVAALTEKGYQVMGIDYEPLVVKFANQNLPNESIKEGNVVEINLPEASIGCYLSVGVAEHFINGPQLVLHEARRVLKKDGVALISVPYLNHARKLLFHEIKTQSIDTGAYHFHQYYFSIEDFSNELINAGFKITKWYPYAVQAFLTREHPFFSWIWNQSFMRYAFQKRILNVLEHAHSLIRKKYGHMVMFVCHPV